MFDEEAADFVKIQMSAIQYVLEIALAHQFGADGCDAIGRAAVERALSAPPNLTPGSGPQDLAEVQKELVAIAKQVDHIFRGAAQRARKPGS
ncbi:MAG: hypothetical protein ABI624_03525 [Casimicrobiaceae bacterium]